MQNIRTRENWNKEEHWGRRGKLISCNGFSLHSLLSLLGEIGAAFKATPGLFIDPAAARGCKKEANQAVKLLGLLAEGAGRRAAA
jgi:hypothetical protein